jgi:glycerophosphoryl diester phosphodiesterase
MALIGTRGRLVIGGVLAVWACSLMACGHGRLAARLRPPGGDFLIIGHRGAPRWACENTLDSFAHALRLGANALELDLSMTRDGHVVLWHDWEAYTITSDVRPVGACRIVRPLLRRPIHAMPLQEFVQDYGYEQEGQRVPVTTFGAFVKRFAKDRRARFFFLDVKIPADLPDQVQPMFQHAVQTLRRYGALSKAVFLTPYENIFYQLHDEAQRWQHATGERVEVALDVEGPQLVRLTEWPSAIRRNQVAGARFAFWGEPLVTVQSWQDYLLQELRQRDAVNATRPPEARLRFIVWTINEPSDLCDLIGLGVDGIMTDEPDRLRAIVRSWDRPGSCRAQ